MQNYDIDQYFLDDVLLNPEYLCDNMIITEDGDVHPFDNKKEIIEGLYEFISAQDTFGKIEYVFVDGKKKDVLVSISVSDHK